MLGRAVHSYQREVFLAGREIFHRWLSILIVRARAGRPAPAAMIEAFAIPLIAAILAAADCRLRSAAGDERRQTIHRFAFHRLRRGLRLLAMFTRLIAIAEVLLTRLLLIAGIRLLLTRLELLLRLRNEAGFCAEAREAVGIIVVVVERVAIDARLLLLRLVLAELFLRRGDQAEIMFGVLVVIFGGNRIARTARVAGELNIFLGNMRSGAANLDVGSVGLEDPGHRVLAAPVIVVVIVVVIPAAHTLVVIRAVSHEMPFTASGS
ncbi:MAG: hypothetical protein BGN84_05845 [Afipia sp. 62-7]|nr:MAG: hypothetical protein BGN84_05845 [Afipia sp. 62-7]